MDGGQQLPGRFLASWLGVDEDSGLYVLVAGIVLMGLTFLACFYCKVYDPIKYWCIKMHKNYCTKKPKAAAAIPPGTPPTPEREHWYLNKTLKIDRQDRDELGPRGDIKGLQGGWYGARNGGFDV